MRMRIDYGADPSPGCRIVLDDAPESRPITEKKINNKDHEKKPANTAAH
jgi:hypothetical protein